MSSLKQRQKFLELKFMGNRRLAEEFAYLQDPNVRKLEKWQNWKQQAENEDRWVSWQRGERSARDRERQEKYRDPLLPRRKKRRYRRIKEKPQYDVLREITRVENREQSAWRREMEVVEAINTPLRPVKDHVPIPPKPPELLAFVKTSVRSKPRHWMEPADWVPFPHEFDATTKQKSGRRGGGLVRVVEVKKKKKAHAAARPPPSYERDPSPIPPPSASSARDAQRPSSSSSSLSSRGPSRSGGIETGGPNEEKAAAVPGNYDVVYRFKLWWFGYVSATTIQRCVRGMLARLWLSFLIVEPRALKRRLACYAIQRVWRGHKGRQVTFALWVKKTSAAMFIQRFMRHLSHIRDVSVGKRREAACVKLQRSWYQLNSILLSARVRAMVQNRREAMSRRKREQGLYWGALRMQIMMVRYLARIRFRKRKKVEHAAATKVQALMRGVWGRKHFRVSKVKNAAAEKAAGLKFNWALARLCSDFLARLRTKKATLLKHHSVVIIQRIFRGTLARNLNKRLKEQSHLVRNWLTEFKHERVPGLMDSKEVDSFYTTVDSHRKVPPRVAKHAKTSVEDLPRALRKGPLFHDLRHVHHHHDNNGSGAHHHHQDPPQLRVGVEIGPTAEAHVAIYQQAPQASLASSLGPQELDYQVRALDQALDLRLRTVSRGLPPSAGLVPHWDTSTQQQHDDHRYGDDDDEEEALALEAAYAEQASRTRPGRLRQRAPDNPASIRRGAAEQRDDDDKDVGTSSFKKFDFEEPPRHGFGAHHEVIDKGSSRFRGDGNVKALDARSRALVHAPDRGAWAGVAPRPNNARKPRDPGAQLVMRDALDMIAQENRERGYI